MLRQTNGLPMHRIVTSYAQKAGSNWKFFSFVFFRSLTWTTFELILWKWCVYLYPLRNDASALTFISEKLREWRCSEAEEFFRGNATPTINSENTRVVSFKVFLNYIPCHWHLPCKFLKFSKQLFVKTTVEWLFV